MEFGLKKRLVAWLTQQLTRERSPIETAPLYDFARLKHELRPCDVILIEGRSHVSDVIKLITQSPWTHTALYIGRLHDIEDQDLRERVKRHFKGEFNAQLIIEAQLGEGTVISTVEKYSDSHIRLCRPKGISHHDVQKVIAYTIRRLGTNYDVRQILDLARFMFPYGILPRRWRSSLFRHNVGQATRTVCSTMLAEAFQTVQFPVLPFAEHTKEGLIHLYQRNPRLFTPRDFDYSPYFDIIKYPFFGLDDVSIYRKLPWRGRDIYCNDLNDCYITPVPGKTETSVPNYFRINLLGRKGSSSKQNKNVKDTTHATKS